MPVDEKKIVAALEKQTKALELMLRPFVIVDVFPRRSINMLYFRVRNVGQTPAYNIKVRPTKDIPFRKKKSSELEFFKNKIGVLGPKEEISFLYDSAIELFNRENSILEFDVSVSYVDEEKISYKNAISINIEMFKDLAFELPPMSLLASDIERLRSETERIARSIDRIEQRQMRENSKKISASKSNSKEDAQ